MKPGKEYTVSWQLLSGTAASLHSRFEPKGLPSGAIFQIDDGDGNGWKEQTRIDHVGAQATNPSAAVHKFRVLPPMMRAGEISRVSMAGTKFEMRANPNTDGLALLAIDDPKEQNQQPALDVASARVTFGLGAAEENGVPITAGRLVFDADLWINGSSNLVINPSLLSYEAPANVGVDLIFDGNQWLRQVKAPEILADIVVISNTAGSQIFEVNMYLPSQLGTQPGANQPWPVSGDPISSCRIERVNSLAIPGYGGATHACRIRRYEDTVEVSDVSMGGRFTSVNTYDKFATVRQEGAETVTVFNERTFRNSTSGPFYIAGIQYSTSTGVHYFRKETTETKRDGVRVQKSIRDYLLHSIGGPGTGSPLGGFGDLLIKDANFNTASTSEVTEIYPNFHYNTTNQQLGAYGAYNPGAFGKPAFRLLPDGGWELYVYDTNGGLTKTYRPFKGQPTAPLSATDSNCLLQTTGMERDPYSILPNPAPAGYEDALKDQRGITEEKNNGVTVSRSQSSYASVTVSGEPAVRTTDKSYFSNTEWVESSTDTYHQTASEALRGKLAARTLPSGEMMTYGYESGDFDVGSRTFTSPGTTGLDMRRSETQGTSANPSGIANKTTRTLSVIDADGRLHQETLQIFTGGTTYESATVTDYFYDDAESLIRVEKDGRIISETDADGLTTNHTDETGVKRTVVKDLSGRTLSESKEGGPTTTYTPNGPTTTIATGSLSRSVTVDLLGRTTTETDEIGATRSFTYPNGGRDQTITYPGNLVVKSTRYPGGMQQHETNTSGLKIVPQYFTHSVVTGGNQKLRTDIGSSTSPRWTETVEDWLGRSRTLTIPAPSGTGTVVTTTDYNDAGQQESESYSSNTNLNARLFEYDSLGMLHREGIDMNANGTLDPATTDRIIEYVQYYEKIGLLWYQVRETLEYQDDNDGTATLISTIKERLSGNSGGIAEHSISIDANGREIENSTAINRTTKTVTRTTEAGDISLPEIETTVNGLIKEVEGPTRPIGYQFDAAERLWKTTDHRTAAVTTRSYLVGTGQLESVADHLDNTTSYIYYTATHKNAGLVKKIENAAQKSSYFEFNDRGQETRQWGETIYPTSRTYTTYGELETLSTYRSGTGWTSNSWPSAPGTPNTTTWKYFTATGRLEYKQDAATKKVSYTWNDNGAIHTREWARNITTTYGYNGAGDATSITYSDGITPSVSITPKRTGQAHTITDAAGLHTFTYEDGGQTDTEIISGSGILAGITLDYSHATNGLAKTLDVTTGATTLYETERTFDPKTGLLQRIESGQAAADYRHHLKSSLIHQITFSHNSQSALVQSRRYDELNRLKAITHFTAGSSLTPVDYTGYQLDELHRREIATRLDGSYWDYDYNDRSEVKGADKKLSDGTLLAGKQFHFDFDNIGNITSKQTGGDSSGAGRRVFTTPANDLNQYASYATPATFDILGQAPASTTVTVNSIAATFQQEFFRAEITATNANTNGDWKSVVTSDGTNTLTGNRYIAPASFTPSYDDDGNLLDDGEWSYAWDAENRLKTITRTTRAQNAGAPYRRLEFTYDAQHRRIERREYHAPTGPVINTERYLYEGWNRVAILNATNQPLQRFTWGDDLSGTPQGAGGVGGLLWIEDVSSTTTHLVCADGNGNITSLINATTKAITAAYDYSPFGETIRQSGPYAEANPYRFSTKPRDAVTGLLYYGYRSYKPSWGVWLNRDPIGESGGENLHGMVINQVSNAVDYLGLKIIASSTPGNNTRIGSALGGMRHRIVPAIAEAKAELSWVQGRLAFSKTMGSKSYRLKYERDVRKVLSTLFIIKSYLDGRGRDITIKTRALAVGEAAEASFVTSQEYSESVIQELANLIGKK